VIPQRLAGWRRVAPTRGGGIGMTPDNVLARFEGHLRRRTRFVRTTPGVSMPHSADLIRTVEAPGRLADFIKRPGNRASTPLDSIFRYTAAHGVTQKPTLPINQSFRPI
jgi:hypothetical protein